MKSTDRTAMHSHPACLGIFVDAAKLRFTSPDGKTDEASGEAGDVAWFEPTTHTTENIGKNDVHTFIVEFKCVDRPVDLSALRGEAATESGTGPDVFKSRQSAGRIQYRPRESIRHMEQMQMDARARKRKKQARLEFDPAMVFGTSKDAEMEIDLDAARYHAQKGQGGDRRA